MGQNIISFPGLGIDKFTVNEVAISLFDGALNIRWYAICICVGIILAYWYFISHGTKKEGIKEDTLINLVLFLIPISVIGARLLYVLTDDAVQATFIDIIAIWKGGLAIYGAIIFGIITTLVFAKVAKVSALKLFDAVAPAVMIGQICGRWGNFFNGEAYGYSENVESFPWRMEVNGLTVHPTFLYEGIWNLIGFLIINAIYRKKKFDGQIFFLYIAWYGFGRAWIEFLRTDSLYIGSTGIKLMVVLGFACFVFGTAIYIFFASKAKKDEQEYAEYLEMKKLKQEQSDSGEPEIAEVTEEVEITEATEEPEAVEAPSDEPEKDENESNDN